MSIKYLKPGLIKNKTILLRVDVNEGIDQNGKLLDDYRIKEILPTIRLLHRDGNKIVLCGHLGRPQGQWQEALSLRPVAKRLAELLKYEFKETSRDIPVYVANHLVFYTGDISQATHRKQLQSIPAKDLVLLENLRFYPGEEESDPVFAKHLAELAEVYVNDSFGVDHHASVSVSGLEKYLPSYAGLLLEKELKSLGAVLKNVKHPFVVMIGGIKLSEKVGVLENLGGKTDKILLGGGLANLFLLSQGLEIGLSKVENTGLQLAKNLRKSLKDKLVLPQDVVVTDASLDKNSIRVKQVYEVGKQDLIVDVGPKTILAFAQELKKAKTIVWNGPLGHFEVKPFDTATMALTKVIGGLGKRKAFAVVGGGETVDAVRLAGQMNHIDHVSTGGGAMLEFLAGKKLPGIEALK